MSWFTSDNKTRKTKWPVWDYMFKYFPLAFLEEVRVAVLGNEQHNPGQPLHWAREKSTDQLNTAMRHLFDYAEAKAKGVTMPRDEVGNAVLAQAVWRLKAQLQLDLEQEAKDPGMRDQVNDIAQRVYKDQLSAFNKVYPEKDGAYYRRCLCGKREFRLLNENDLPPTVIKDGETHSPHGCSGGV
jgi:hypothetical protein